MGEKHTHDKILKNSDDVEFNKLIIKQTNVSIQEELSHLSAGELKASVIVAVVPVIFGLLSVIAPTTFAKIFQNFDWYDLILLIPFILLILAFVFALQVIFPRTKFDLWDPRDSNDEYIDLKEEGAIIKKLKEERIDDFESIRDSRDKDVTYLRIGYALLIVGSLTLLLSTTLLSLQT